MKQKICRILALVLLFCVVSCKKDQDKNEVSQLANAQWLIGRWENNSRAGNLSETWTRVNDSVFSSATFFVVGTDTVFSENVRLSEKAGHLYYEVSVAGENDNKAILFKSSKVQNGELVFENAQHDYPNKIHYHQPVADSLVAIVSGIQKGAPITERFAMKRVEVGK